MAIRIIFWTTLRIICSTVSSFRVKGFHTTVIICSQVALKFRNAFLVVKQTSIKTNCIKIIAALNRYLWRQINLFFIFGLGRITWLDLRRFFKALL
jgi:hypothetical protein